MKPYFDRFDIIEAHYHFSVNYGPSAKIQMQLNRMGYKPNFALREGVLRSLNAHKIYKQLVKKYHATENYRKTRGVAEALAMCA